MVKLRLRRPRTNLLLIGARSFASSLLLAEDALAQSTSPCENALSVRTTD